MYIENTVEWWKLRIYQEVSEFLENPDAKHHAKLTAALESYRAFSVSYKSDANNSYNEYEQLISA